MDTVELNVLRQQLKSNGVTQKDMAAELGIPQSAVSNIFKGKRYLRVDEARILFRLAGLEHEMKPDQSGELVPMIPLASIKGWQESLASTEKTVRVPSELRGGSADFAVEITDDSVGTFYNGIVMLVDTRQRELFNNRLVLLQKEDGRGIIRLFKEDPARFVSLSELTAEPDVLLGSTNLTVIGRCLIGFKEF